MKREYIKPEFQVTSFETVDVTSIEVVKSTILSPTNHTTRTFKLNS